MDVNAIDLTGAGDETAELEVLAADNVKRVVRAAQRAEPVGDLRVPRAEDRLAPGRHLSGRASYEAGSPPATRCRPGGAGLIQTRDPSVLDLQPRSLRREPSTSSHGAPLACARSR